jgi:hypothetical protein
LAQINDLNDQLDEMRNGAPAQALTELQREVTELKPKADRVTTLEETIKKMVETRRAQLPEGIAKLFPASYTPEQQLAWLDEALGMPAGSFGSAAGGNGPNPPPAGGAASQEALDKEIEGKLRASGQYPRVG